MDTDNMRIEVCLFGGPCLSTKSHCVSAFPTRKTAEFVGYLAYHAGTRLMRQDMAEVLWPNADPESSRNRLKQALAASKRLLEPLEIDLGRPVIGSTRGQAWIEPDSADVDTALFDKLRIAALQTTDAMVQRELLGRAERLYRGSFMAGCDGEWVWLERTRLEEDLLQVLCAQARLCRLTGDLVGARDYALRGVRIDPLAEQSRRELLAVLTAMGAHSAAYRNYREFERLLRDQMGVEPEGETRDIVERRLVPTG